MQQFAWNDSILCWVFLGQGMLCYLYRRSIEESIFFTPHLVFLFIAIIFGSLGLLPFADLGELILSPITPTLLILAVWTFALIQSVVRFYPRRCNGCGAALEVSVYDPRAQTLYGDVRLQEADVWFCSKCSRVDNCTKGDLKIISLPTPDNIGVATRRAVSDTGAVKLSRILLRPTLRGRNEDVQRIERYLVRKMNRIALHEE